MSRERGGVFFHLCWNRHHLCWGDRRINNRADRKAERIFFRFAQLLWYDEQVRLSLENIRDSVQKLLLDVKVAVVGLRIVLRRLVPADEFAATFGPLLQLGQNLDHHVPLWRIQRVLAVVLGSEEEPTYGDEAMHDGGTDDGETRGEEMYGEETHDAEGSHEAGRMPAVCKMLFFSFWCFWCFWVCYTLLECWKLTKLNR